MKVKKKLGDMLIKAGLLTDELLKQALQDQSRVNLKLGQYLVRKGLVGEYNLVETAWPPFRRILDSQPKDRPILASDAWDAFLCGPPCRSTRHPPTSSRAPNMRRISLP